MNLTIYVEIFKSKSQKNNFLSVLVRLSEQKGNYLNLLLENFEIIKKYL